MISSLFLFMEWKRSSRPRSINKPPIFYCLSIFFFSFCALFCSISSRPTCQASTCPLSTNADIHFQKYEKRREEVRMVSLVRRTSMSLARRFLGGPGSSPLRCTSKCSKCTPCKPVHVQCNPECR